MKNHKFVAILCSVCLAYSSIYIGSTAPVPQDDDTDTDAADIAAAVTAGGDSGSGSGEGDNSGSGEGDDSGSGEGDDSGSGEGDDSGSGEGDDSGSGEGDDSGSGEGDDSGSSEGDDSGAGEESASVPVESEAPDENYGYYPEQIPSYEPTPYMANSGGYEYINPAQTVSTEETGDLPQIASNDIISGVSSIPFVGPPVASVLSEAKNLFLTPVENTAHKFVDSFI